MTRKHAPRRRRLKIVLASVLGLSLLFGGTAFAAYRYDTATREQILPGVTVEGVDLGGMTREEAIRAVSDAAGSVLERDIQVTAGEETWQVAPTEFGAAADVTPKVDEALGLTDDYSWFSRVTRRLFDRPLDKSLDLSYQHDQAQIDRFVAVVANEINVRPARPRFDLENGEVKRVQGREGRALDEESARAALVQALSEQASAAAFPVQEVKPKTSKKHSPYTIIVKLSKNKLFVYKGLKRVKTYRVATGSPGFPTPRGEWTIWNKQVNPTWINPAPDGWGAGMPASIPGGPGGPLGTRALYLDAPGIRIHGTPASYSIGTYASHGCIRMLMPEVEELYEIIPLSTTVLIV